MIEQKPVPLQVARPAPDVVLEGPPDDIHIRFKLINKCEHAIYYLAYVLLEDDRTPAGFMIYRNKDGDWEARSPAWRRERGLTSPYSYHWVQLRPAEFKEFEYSDQSLIKGERSLSIFVSIEPSHDKRSELLAEPFMVKVP
jgi:hypothetical protein